MSAGPSCATDNIVEACPLQLSPGGSIQVDSNVAMKYELMQSGELKVSQSDEDAGTSSSEKAASSKRMKKGRRRQLNDSPKPSSSKQSSSRPVKCPDSASEEEQDDFDAVEVKEESEMVSAEHWQEEGPFELGYITLSKYKSLEKEWREVKVEGVGKMNGANEGMIGDDLKVVFDERTAMIGETEQAEGIVGECVFEWKEEFESFSGQKETYARQSGSTIPSACPYELFTAVWEEDIMNVIVNETNTYARQTIATLRESASGISASSRLLEWKETDVNEMYVFFSILIYMTLCYRSRIDEYWTTGILEMPGFRSLMTRDRYLILSKFIHFIDNEVSTHTLTSYERKIHKILPILNHCNRKFQKLYVPKQYLSLDESLLLWKGRLSWVQCIRTKAARFGIKSFDLCESDTGYLLKTLLYAGKNTSALEASIAGFENHTAKIVLKLSEGYLDVGHVLVMDNWYNRLSLTRYLKNRHTDVIGTQNRRQKEVPESIRSLDESSMLRGQVVARHSGDISLVAWKDVKLVTMVSTHHTDDVYRGQRAGQAIEKPVVVRDYSKYMGGVDLKDQRLSMYPMERKRATKWYMKVFRRLLNISLTNTYTMYLANCGAQGLSRIMSHRQYRYAVADLLVRCHKIVPVGKLQHFNAMPNRLDRGPHKLDSTERSSQASTDGSFRLQRRRCARCAAAGRRRTVPTQCSRCNVGLCIGRCFDEYHTLRNLRTRAQRK